MIIEFKVANFRSIREQQTLSLAAGTGSELENNICASDFSPDLKLVRTAVIYGANAAGKSNCLNVLAFMREFILNSARESQQGEPIQVASFAFCNKPSEFEITFIKDKTRYQYGFLADRNQIFEEWLFAYPHNRGQQWFSRIYNKKNKQYNWKFSTHFKGQHKKTVELTRNNVLFLSNAVNLNNEQLRPVFEWFQKDLMLIDSPSAGKSYRDIEDTLQYIKTKYGKKKVLDFMKVADPSIDEIRLEEKPITEANLKFPSSMPKELQDALRKELIGKMDYKISLVHSNNIPLKLNDESEGTQKLLAMAGLWLDALDNGRVLIVDEMDNSLHPLAVRFLIELLYNSTANKKNAQLIFTTHDTSLLDTELFRRDQVWFVEKDKNNATQLYPLLDFSPRKNEAIGRGYLMGRYGAIPYIGEWRF